VKRDVAADLAPRPAAPSLMSIVEDVSRSNRGWNEIKMRNSVGRKRTARANLLDGMVVRAPPPVPRGALESLNVAEMFGSQGRGTTVGSATKPPPPPKATGCLRLRLLVRCLIVGMS
jgi:hypothetical protein